MLVKIKSGIQKLTNAFGYKIVPLSKNEILPKDNMEVGAFREIYKRCEDYTMTSRERMYALYQAIKYIVNSKVPGDFVECGVWRGGSSMLMALTLLECKEVNRKIYLYDTFEGMTEPTSKDKLISNGGLAYDMWKTGPWCSVSIDEVKANMLSLGYPENKIILIKGKVEDTIPATTPSQISLLRLDTDWYESTYHELKYLFPLISNKGVTIIDDYGCWAGAKEATDEYFSKNNISILLNRIDGTGRLGIKIE